MLEGHKSNHSLPDYYIHLQKLADESLSHQNSEKTNMKELTASFHSNNEIASEIKINSNNKKSNNIKTINILSHSFQGYFYTNDSTISKGDISNTFNNKKDYDPIPIFIILAAFYTLQRYMVEYQKHLNQK